MKASIWLMPLYMRDFREFKTSKISASETPVILNLGTQMHRKHLLWHLKNFFIIVSATAYSWLCKVLFTREGVRMLIFDWSITEVQAPPIPPSLFTDAGK